MMTYLVYGSESAMCNQTTGVLNVSALGSPTKVSSKLHLHAYDAMSKPESGKGCFFSPAEVGIFPIQVHLWLSDLIYWSFVRLVVREYFYNA